MSEDYNELSHISSERGPLCFYCGAANVWNRIRERRIDKRRCYTCKKMNTVYMYKVWEAHPFNGYLDFKKRAKGVKNE